MTSAGVSITKYQPVIVPRRRRRDGMMVRQTQISSGIDLVVEFLTVTLRRTSPDVLPKRLLTVCVKNIAVRISLVTVLTTSE